ncbi:MAG: DUF3597 family protein [Anaerolineales bacterium]
MGFFDKILEKIGIKKKEETGLGSQAQGGLKAKDDIATPSASVAKQGMGGKIADKLSKEDALPEEGMKKPIAISEVDVVAKLESLAQGKDLNWKVSIVDLLKLLDLDSSKEARIELAKELGCPADLIGGDYSKMNVWLHKEVLRKIAANGGNIPKELLD